MRIICLMGKSESKKHTIKNMLGQLGYNVLMPYTTRKPKAGEQNGVEYYFVNKEQFMELVKKGIIMEWTEIDDEYYGYPHPIGARDNVVVVDPDGYFSIKRIYKLQVIGVYLDKEYTIVDKVNRVKEMKLKYNTSNIIDLESRKRDDLYRYRKIHDKVDIVIDDLLDKATITAKILKYISENKKSKVIVE